MLSEQKFRPSNLAAARLILTGVILICLVLVFFAAFFIDMFLTGLMDKKTSLPIVSNAPVPDISPDLKLSPSPITGQFEEQITLNNVFNFNLEVGQKLIINKNITGKNYDQELVLKKIMAESPESSYYVADFEVKDGENIIPFSLNNRAEGHKIIGNIVINRSAAINSTSVQLYLSQAYSVAEWEKYANQEYGFKLMYPGDWTLSDITDYEINTNGSLLNIAIGMPSSASIEGYVQVFPDDNYKDAEDRFMKNYANNYGQKIVGRKNFSIDDISGEEIVIKDDIMEGQERDRAFLILRDGKIYAIGLTFTGVYYTEEADAQLDKILSAFKFIEKPCAQEDVAERIDCFTDYVSKNPISEDIIGSDEKLKEYFSENFDNLTFVGISRGKFDKFNNKNTILVSMYWSAGKHNQSHIFILKENAGKNWDLSHQELDYYIDFINEPKVLIKNEPVFFVGRSNYTGGTCVPISWDTMIYRLENNKFNLLWKTEYFADGEIYDPKQEENADSARLIEIFGADITYKDLDKDGNSEIIKEGTRQMCQEKDACYSSDCIKFFGKENIYEVFKWNEQKQTFLKIK